MKQSINSYGAVCALRKAAVLLFICMCFALPARAGTTLLAFGDSLTQGYGLPEADGFVPQLDAWLRENGAKDVSLINAGVSGDTTAGGLNRIDWSLTEDIDGVILALGGNDLLRGIDLDVMKSNLDGILAAIGKRNLPVILAGLPAPPNYGPEYKREFKAMFRDLAKKYDAVLYPSFLAGMGQGNVLQVMMMMQSDGIHPNAKGVRANVDHIGPVVLEMIDGIGK